MKNPLYYWKYMVAAGTVNALIFIAYRIKHKSKLNEKNKSLNVKEHKDINNEKTKKRED